MNRLKRYVVILFLSLVIFSQTGFGIIILVTNDDGYDAPGIVALVKAIKDIGKVVVVAPASNQSGKGQSLTLSSPVFIRKVNLVEDVDYYAVQATPATCVKLALHTILKDTPPNIIVSGINKGQNMGFVNYVSGTCGAAREGAVTGIQAIAFSQCYSKNMDYTEAAKYARYIVEYILKKRIPEFTYLNVNFPPSYKKIKGIRITFMSDFKYKEIWEERKNLRGHTYYWSTIKAPDKDFPKGSDIWAVKSSYISITPINILSTDKKSLRLLIPLTEVVVK